MSKLGPTLHEVLSQQVHSIIWRISMGTKTFGVRLGKTYGFGRAKVMRNISDFEKIPLRERLLAGLEGNTVHFNIDKGPDHEPVEIIKYFYDTGVQGGLS